MKVGYHASHRQEGFASIILMLFVIVVLAVAAYAGYRVLGSQTAATNGSASTLHTLPPVAYTGQSAADGQPSSTSSSSTGSGSGSSSSSSSSSSGGNTSTTPAMMSGISGHVSLTVVCEPPKACADSIRPYQAEVVVESSTGSPVTSFTSAADGSFKVLLDPGTYILVPQSYDSGKITAPSQTVKVSADAFTSTTINYTEKI